MLKFCKNVLLYKNGMCWLLNDLLRLNHWKRKWTCAVFPATVQTQKPRCWMDNVRWKAASPPLTSVPQLKCFNPFLRKMLPPTMQRSCSPSAWGSFRHCWVSRLQVTSGYSKAVLWVCEMQVRKGSSGLSRCWVCGPSWRLPWVFFLNKCTKLTCQILMSSSFDVKILPRQTGEGGGRLGWQSGRIRWEAAWLHGEEVPGSPCRNFHHAGSYPPPGTDGKTSLVCPSASQCGTERVKTHWPKTIIRSSSF